MSAPSVVSLSNVSFSYGGPRVLDGVNLEVEEHEFLGIVGPNAGGKSTLLKLMLGLLEPLRGEVRVLGKPPQRSRTQVGYVPQYPQFSRDFPITVEQTVMMGRLGMSGLFGNYRRHDRAVARQAMAETEVLDLAARQLCTLSGGQLQRVLVARALACEPRILMLDEPTANIDMRVETEIFDLLKRFNKRMTIIVVSHDIGFISGYVNRVACLNRTLICHHTAAIDGDTIRSLYDADVKMVEHRH
ncbi:metal ABC transporter ATP-binding protein [Sedimenticola hydrogenitrophicus]|uniref:metal ABC transporter ATP-binding protein n=1 Tax=Sedimenticola hydrogenitrophicus TaxID=2967975 RepID=UPI0021A3D6BB|nr:ABC transporter ATP-binding protein [Sedimenticola hydrogenitrophicus]